MTTQLQGTQPPAPTRTSAQPAIQVSGLTKIYGSRGESTSSRPSWFRSKRSESENKKAAADDVSFSVAPGEFFVIMGLSGSGKSTVLRMLNRLVEPTSGELLIEGRDVATMPEDDLRKLRNSKINMVFQHFALFPHRTVRENAAYALHVRHFVVTLWQPHWAFSRFPLKVLDDTQTAFGPPDQMQIVATKGWSAANPEAAGWLKNFKITPEQLSDLMLKIQTAGKGKEQEAAKQWAADNKSVVDAWFNAPS